MGGTSTDVSRFDGRYELEYETEKAGVRVVAPMMAIETVAAGGGSICHFDGVKLVVGPDSAGADPGPACYGRGGPLTVTDVNFFLGKILPERFPVSAGSRGRRSAARPACAAKSQRATGKRYEPLRTGRRLRARGQRQHGQGDPLDLDRQGLRPARLRAGGVRRRRGAARLRRRPRAGHAADPASIPTPALLSAYGIGLADVVRHRAAGVYRPYDERDGAVARSRVSERLTDEARREVLAEGMPAEQIEVRRSLDLRYRGVDAALPCSQRRRHGSYADAFCRCSTQRLYGYAHGDRPLEIVAARVEVVGRTADRIAAVADVVSPQSRESARATPPPGSTAKPHETARLRPRAARAGASRLIGPAIVSRVIVHHGDRSRLAGRGAHRRRVADRQQRHARFWPLAESTAHRDCRRGSRPGDARNLQQPVRRHRRTDGHHAAQHVEQRERQGAARFQLRAVHRRRRPGRQRAAHSGPPGGDGRNGARDDRRQPDDRAPATCSSPTIPIAAARTCPT